MMEEQAISIVRIFDAPRELVFGNWVRAEDVATWFAPVGFTVAGCAVDARPGGHWWVEYESTGGDRHREYGEFREVVPPERLVFTLTQQDGAGNTGPETLVRVILAERGGKTEMTFAQTGFRSAAVRDGNAGGWRGCFDKLDTHLAVGAPDPSGDAEAAADPSRGAEAAPAPSGDAEAQIRREFAEWFRDSAAKDINGVMTKIADDVVSYEHAAPMVYRGADAVREVCQYGFDIADGEFRWDIPDLEVMVRGDLAVTWGLNRMRVTGRDGATVESWSRGTRIFQRRDGRWQMIHQHVSFPFDPSNGQVVTTR